MWRIKVIPTLASLTIACTLVTSAFAQEDKPSPNPAPVQPSAASIPARVTTFASNLEHPWGLTFLPGGRLLVTERPGRLRLITQTGEVSSPIQGVPSVFSQDRAGLFDVARDPDFASNRLVYLAYAEPAGGDTSRLAVARGILNQAGTALDAVQVIFRQQPAVAGTGHLGGRLQFAPDGTLFVTTGERFHQPEEAQDLSNHLGKIIRINPDGSVPPDNPFVGRTNARPEIWSYGHRNVQGAAIHPETSELWATEHGPRGGDELNIVLAGLNYGWPLVSWGTHVNAGPFEEGEEIPNPPTRPDLEQSIYHWPQPEAIAPSGATFYTGDTFSTWRGNFFIAGLRSQVLIRLTLNGQQVTGEERIALGDRIRDVQQGPDGFLYLLTDNPAGRVLRIEPASAPAQTIL